MGEGLHYRLYGVTDQWRIRRSDIVARVYRLDTEVVPLKVRRHRLRCNKRMASRTVFDVVVPDFRIVVCWSGDDGEAPTLGVRFLQDGAPAIS